MGPTIVTRTIEIEGMSGEPSVLAVSAALRRVSGVSVKSVWVGLVTIACTYPAAFASACAAIHYAGFGARESRNRPGAPEAAPAPDHRARVTSEESS